MMGSRLLLAAVSFAVLAACSDNKPAAPAEPAVVAAKPSDDPPGLPPPSLIRPRSASPPKASPPSMRASPSPSPTRTSAGVTYILGKGGDIAAFKSHGVQSGDPKTGTPMTNDSMFRIYSMSKPITGVAMMQLFEQGKWQLDDPISKYVPELGFQKLLDDTRRDLASSYVRQGTRSVTEITFLLGFTDTSNFTRAFKRWTGMSPTEFKASSP
jgi:CubicO group peptidase (beta-lactamase class C family)